MLTIRMKTTSNAATSTRLRTTTTTTTMTKSLMCIVVAAIIAVVVSSSSRFCHASIGSSSRVRTAVTSSSFLPKKIRSNVVVNNNSSWNNNIPFSLLAIPRGGSGNSEDAVVSSATAAEAIIEATESVVKETVEALKTGEASTSVVTILSHLIVTAIKGLGSYMDGPKMDTLILLLTTALTTPLCKSIGTSPILGYLLFGLLFGPNGCGFIQDIHTTELLADIGIIFFLFEMGLHLDFTTLMSMKQDVFGLGGAQFLVTATAVALICKFAFHLSTAAQIVIGGGLALSSSAFVLQLLKDKEQMGTKFGRSSFGVLLLQDLAVVPLLVITPLLAGSGDASLCEALSSAGVKAVMALSTIGLLGKFVFRPFFNTVAKSQSQEAYVGAIVATVLGCSFLTEGLGLSNTLGAFLAGMLLSDTSHRSQIEKEVGPIRGILVGLFFFSVGFEIDLKLIQSSPILVAGLVLGITTLKAIIASLLGLTVGGLHGADHKGTAVRLGLILSQGGEFAFVAFRLARSCGIFTDDLTKLLLTCVSLTMGLTPFLDDIGAKLQQQSALPPPVTAAAASRGRRNTGGKKRR